MKILFFVIIGILNGKIVYENKEVRLLEGPHPVLILKEGGKNYKIVVSEKIILLFKENEMIFNHEKILDKKIILKEKFEEGIYDVQGRKLGRTFSKKRGIYFKKLKDKNVNKIFILK